MTAFARTRVGPPEGGRYLVGDVVTDGANTKWKCVKGGMADGAGANPQNAMFTAVPNVPQGAPAAKTTSVTLTAAELLAGIVTGNQGASGAAAYTLPLASAMDTAFPSLQVDEGFDFFVINLSTVAAEDITMTTNTGWTLVGNMLVIESAAGNPAGSNGHFRVRKTGASLYSLYRVA
jgi:hypothetical protein